MGWPPEDLSQEWEIQGLLVGKEEATDRELATENKPSRSVLAYRMSKDVSQEGGTTKGAEKQGSPSRDTAPRNPGWVMVRNTHGVVRCAHQGPGWVEPPQKPLYAPRPFSCFRPCASSRPLPGRVTSRPPREPRSSYAKNVRVERGEGGPFRPRPNTPTPLPRVTPPTRPLPRSAVATATGLKARSAVYSQPGARKLGWEVAGRTSLGVCRVVGGARHWSQGSLTPGRRH